MFAGAIIPGIIMGLSYVAYVIIRCAINPSLGPAAEKTEKIRFLSKDVLVEGFKYLIPPGLLVFMVLGSIFFGVASPTEAGAVGSIGSILLSIVYGKFTWEDFKQNCYTTLRVTSMIIFIACAANLYTGAFLSAGCGQVITDFLLGLGLGSWGIFITMLIIIFFMGCFIDWIGILLIVVPIFSPILLNLGFDSLWVGLVICTSLQISFLTPPFAYSIFYLKGLNLGLELKSMYAGIMPFVCLQFITVILIILFPQLCLWLPKVLGS
jgi:tripartite ATP-independent transporter DctM subunit